MGGIGAGRSPGDGPQGGGGVIAAGEVITGLLPTSEVVSIAAARGLLESAFDDTAVSWSRPLPQVTSSTRLTGVDCAVPTASSARARAVGTVESWSSVVGGLVVQGCAQVWLVPGRDGHRRAWSHYLARPGTVEVLTRWQRRDIADGILAYDRQPGLLNLEAIAWRGLDQIQRHADRIQGRADRIQDPAGQVQGNPAGRVQGRGALDRNPLVTPVRGRLRWVALVAADRSAPRLELTVVSPWDTRARLLVPDTDVELVGPLCADLARHEWLLSSAGSLVDRARIGSRPAVDVLRVVRPVLDYLVPVWFPAARLPLAAHRYWRAYDVASGIREQWALLLQRIRDQARLAAAAFVAEATAGPVSAPAERSPEPGAGR